MITATDNKNEIILGLEYALDPGWKTYWKSPGGGGFPQKLVWNNSSNIEDIKMYNLPYLKDEVTSLIMWLKDNS